MAENSKFCDSEFGVTGETSVIFWSQQRLRFQTINEPEHMRDCRKTIYQAIKRMKAPVEGRIFHATLDASTTERFDLENVLVYNVGPGGFREVTKHGLCIERQNENTDPERTYIHRYRFEQPPDSLTGNSSMTFDFKLEKLRGRVKPLSIWSAAVQSLMALKIEPTTILAKDERFELRIELITSREWNGNLAYQMKPLLDGIISALHFQPPSMVDPDVIAYMAKTPDQKSLFFNMLTGKDHRILGEKDKLVYTGNHSIIWNPDDDRCDLCSILIKRDSALTQHGSVHCKVSVAPRAIGMPSRSMVPVPS
jgi:hypothetical protein